MRFWDLTSGEQVKRLEGHADYVRSAAVSPANSFLWATGIYHLPSSFILDDFSSILDGVSSILDELSWLLNGLLYSAKFALILDWTSLVLDGFPLHLDDSLNSGWILLFWINLFDSGWILFHSG